MSSQYDKLQFPPAPVLEIGLSAPQESAGAQRHLALIDTGSDFTIVPLEILQDIDATESRPARVRGLWGNSQQVTLYYVDIHLQNGIVPSAEVIGTDDARETQVILGRNVLNKLILLLDGRELQTDILERRPLRF